MSAVSALYVLCGKIPASKFPALRLSIVPALLTLVLACTFTPISHAQPSPPKPAQLRFLFLDETAGAYALKFGDQFHQVSSAPYTISPPYIPANLRPIDLYKTSTTPDPSTGKFPRLKVATFTPPSNTTSALVIITPRSTGTTSTTPSYAVEFINSDPTSFPGGSIRILNRGLTTLAVQFSTDQVVAAPGDTRLLTPTTDDRGRIRARVAVQTPDTWKLISDNVAIVNPDNRLTGVLVYSPSGMKFRFNKSILAARGDPPPSHVWLTYTDRP